MLNSYFRSLVLAVLTSLSVAATAAPAAKNEPAAPTAVVQPSSSTMMEKIDLNKADAVTMQRELAGVGETKARAIVAYRESNGAFSSVDELLEVNGIGKAILERNREKLVVN